MGNRKSPPEIDHPYVFSVSQAETFIRCPRKWALEKIDGVLDPGSDSTKLGGEVHEQLENFLEKGVPINVRSRAGKIALPAVPHLPPPLYPGMQIEDWFAVKIGNAYYRGLKDVQILSGWRTTNPFVSDHKTTKNFAWAKTAEDLTGGRKSIGNIQAGVYAHDAMIETGQATVDLQWTYLRTTATPKAEPTITSISKEQVSRILEHLEEVTEQMIQTKKNNPTALTVVQNPLACDAFGGCAHKDLCKLTPQQKLRAMMSQKTQEEGVLGRLKQRKEAKEKGTSSLVVKAKETVVETTGADVVEETEAKVNPPEEEIAPVYTAESEAKKPRKTKQAVQAADTGAATPAVVAGNLFARAFNAAVEAFVETFAEDIAARVEQRLKK